MALKMIRKVPLGSRLGFGPWKSGCCPWCSTTYFRGRSGHQKRHCDECGATFNRECPNCANPQNSLGFNELRQEWGCDQCGAIFIEGF